MSESYKNTNNKNYNNKSNNKSKCNIKKIAIKYEPPTLGFIFLHKKNQKKYLLEVNLTEQLKTELEPINICNWIYATYGDVVNLKTYPQEQIVRMINKIINHN